MKRLLLLALLSSACQLKAPTQPCESTDDCPAPLVCCTSGYYLSLNDLTGPTCGLRNDCPGDFLPFLPEGAPCDRAPVVVAGETCQGGLVCCARTMTCATGATCDAAPVPPEMTVPAGLSCIADSDCTDGAVCCGITFSSRSGGTCQSIRMCGGGGFPQPNADAGVSATNDASMSDLTATICEAAFCDANGPRAPSAAERAACLASGLTPTETCLDAVQASRSYCAFVLRPRFASAMAPVLPAACRGASAPDPLAAQACARLAACNHLGVVSASSCEGHLAGLGYDALSRIIDAPACAFPMARLGWSPQNAASRCATAADCPAEYACEATDSAHGTCIRSCSSDAQCTGGGRCLQRHCYATCDPLQDSNRAAVEASCEARIVLDGPSEIACHYTVAGGGLVVGACTPVPLPGSCMNGPEALHAGTSPRRAHGYTCGTVATGTITRHNRCVAGDGPDPCAEGVCLASTGRCTDPCVASPFAPACTNGESCVAGDRGWGIIGSCQ